MSAILPTLYLISHPHRNHPYPPSSVASSSSRFFSHPTRRSPPLPLSATSIFLFAFSRCSPPRCRLESFRLPTPYKRSCCPFITTTLATTTRPKLPPPCVVLFSFLSLPYLRFVPSSFAPPPTHFPSTPLVFVYFLPSYMTPRFSLHLTLLTVGVRHVYRDEVE